MTDILMIAGLILLIWRAKCDRLLHWPGSGRQQKEKKIMKKGRLVIEMERNGDEMTTKFEVSDMTLQEICIAVGTGINNIICDKTAADAGRFFMRLQAVRDIAYFLGLEILSKKIDSVVKKAKEQIADEKEN